MTIHIGTICKNIESSFPYLKLFFQKLSKKYSDIRFCVYENNSTDSTKKLLQELSSLIPNTHILFENILIDTQLENSKVRTWDNNPCRMELIASARNKLCEMLELVEYKDKDLVLFFDSDMVNLPSMDVLFNYLDTFPENINGLFANGLINNGTRYYDMYAFRNNQQPMGPEILGDEFWKKMPQFELHNITEVFSAFGGLAIYKAKEIRGIRYSAVPTSDLNEYIKYIANKTGFQQKPVSTHLNGSLLGIYLFDKNEFFYHSNSGYNYPIVCEHTPFNASLWKRGFGRFLIDPNLKYYSSS